MRMRIAGACFAGLIVFPLVPFRAFAQSAPDMQRVLDRLDKLEKQNQELMAEIQALRSELGQTNREAVPPQPAAPAPTLAERMEVQESRTAELAQSKIETSQRIPVSLTG